MTIRVGIIGVGNCAKSLVEGVALYSETGRIDGLAFPVIGGYTPRDIEFVLAYDVDERKVGRPLHEAIRTLPNCAVTLHPDASAVCGKTIVRRGPLFDGVPQHMRAETPNDRGRFLIDESVPQPSSDDLVRAFREAQMDVALIYLPTGSRRATEFYVEALLEARVPFVNCIPVFIVSDPSWGERIKRAGIPAVGDDMRSQVGASVLSQVLQEMLLTRGAVVDFHCQTNHGGNTDFHNMTDRSRLVEKKRSKEGVITSQNDLRGLETPPGSVYAGPSEYIPYLGDNKVAHLRIEARIFGGIPITLDARLSVQDSPNSAGVVIDAIRYLVTARDKGVTGPLYGPSAATQKTPPRQMPYAEAYAECVALAGWGGSGGTGLGTKNPQSIAGGRAIGAGVV